MALLDALRALTAFSPPTALPDCDLDLLGDVLEAHGLAPIASYALEHTRLGASLPQGFRERLLSSWQGVANDNVLKLVTLRGWLREVNDVPVVLLDAAAYVDWLYPHMAFRPVGELRAAVAGEHGAAFAATLEKSGVRLVSTGEGARTAVFSDGRLELHVQEGLWAGGPADPALFARRTPARAFGPTAARPSTEDALLATVADQAQLGLHAPLLTYLDLRELLNQGPDASDVLRRAGATGLSRALHGATLVVAHFWPEVADAAAAVRPPLGAVERLAVERVIEGAKDPSRLRHLRGSESAARLVVAP